MDWVFDWVFDWLDGFGVNAICFAALARASVAEARRAALDTVSAAYECSVMKHSSDAAISAAAISAAVISGAAISGAAISAAAISAAAISAAAISAQS